jgi:hypothetical protein
MKIESFSPKIFYFYFKYTVHAKCHQFSHYLIDLVNFYADIKKGKDLTYAEWLENLLLFNLPFQASSVHFTFFIGL